jgi:hypothetical protein
MTVEELLDREAIRDCVFRYCRGADRVDEALMRSSYWPDATDQHGGYSGSARGFIDNALKTLRISEPGIHQVHNILIDFQPGGALVESYFSAWNMLPAPNGLRNAHQKGRYVDWFEKRNGEWRIKDRTVVFDYVEPLPMPEDTREQRYGSSRPLGAPFPDDPIYTLRR